MNTRTVRPGELERDLVARLAVLDERLATRRKRTTTTTPARTRSRLARVGLGTVGFLFVISAAMATNVGGFEIDANQGVEAEEGNLATINRNAYYSGNDAPAGDDWVDGGPNNGLFALSGSAPHTAAEDCYGSNIDENESILQANGGAYDDIAFICDGNSDSKFASGGAAILTEQEEDIVSPSGKQIDDIWPIKGGSVPGKDDFSHAMLAIRSDHDSPCDADADLGDKLLYLGAQRGTNNGDAFWGFEFDQVAPTGFDNLKTHVTTDYSLNFNRTVGDVLVSFVSEGGGDAVLELFAWNGTTFVLLEGIADCPDSAPQGDSLIATNTEFVDGNDEIPNEQRAPTWNTPICSPTITDEEGNTCRLASDTGGFPAGSNDFALASRTFFEAVVDLTAFDLNDICGNNAILTSRSAHPLESADIKDVAGTTLNVCFPELEVTKSANPTTICAGLSTAITFTYTVENTGNLDLTNVDVSDDQVPGAQAAFEAANLLANGNTDTLDVGDSVTFTLSENLSASQTNTLTVDADSIAGANTASDTASATVTAVDCDIEVTKSANPTTICAGLSTLVTFTYNVSNPGDVALTGVTVSDDQVAGAQAAFEAANLLANGNTTTLDAGDSVTFTLSETLSASQTNTITASGSALGHSPADTASATVTAVDCDIEVTKSGPDETCTGVQITYSFTVSNPGDVALTGVTVSDNTIPGAQAAFEAANLLANGNTTTLDAGDSVTFTLNATHNVAGTVTNTVTASGNALGKTPADTDTASESVVVNACGGNIFHTGTTCRQYLGIDPPSGLAGTQLTEVLYGVRQGLIHEVNPGVFFYYSTIEGTAGSTQVWVDQIPPGTYPNPFATKQVRVFDADCNAYLDFSLTSTANGDALLTINGTSAGTDYIISVKYDPTNLRGLTPPAGFATVNYAFQTKVFVGGVWVLADEDDDGVDLNKKP